MKKAIKVICMGIGCVLLALASSWYSIKYNDSRLVVPMDFSTYAFQPKDLPMLLSVALVSIYGIYLFILLLKTIIKNQKTKSETKTTRKLNPKLGLLGFLGFLGLLGFWTYQIDKTIYPFCFFLFFGFFGFFFEGKMSNTLMDERFRENAVKAQLISYKIGYAVLFVMLLLLGRGALMGNLEYTLIFLVCGISLTLAAVIFLSEYLLYRFDHADKFEDNEEK